MIADDTNLMAKEVEQSEGRLHDVKVLVLDDEEGVRRMAHAALTKSGCHVQTACDGHEGLQKLLQSDFDVLVVDVKMDLMDGITFLQEARKIWPWLGVVIMTGYAAETYTAQARAMGVNRILEKPVDLKVLLSNVLEEAVGKRQRVEMPASLSLDRVQYQLGILRQLSENAIAAKSLVEALRGLSAGLGQLLPCSVVGVLGLEEEERVLILTVEEPVNKAFLDEIRTEIQHQYEALSSRALPEDGLRVQVEGVACTVTGSTEIGSTFTVPVITGGELNGLLILGATSCNAYTTADISFLYHAANHLSAIFVALSRMRELAVHDGLTGLYNRRRLEEELALAWERSARYDHVMSVAIMDIDNFKALNDTHGHPVGDKILREFSTLVQKVARTSDILGRYGGDEFVVVLPVGDIVAARAFSERLLSEVRGHIFCAESHALRLKTSIGIAHSHNSAKPQSGQDIVDHADKAMLMAKRSGGNRVCVWSPRMEEPDSGSASAEGGEGEAEERRQKVRARVMVVDDEPSVGRLLRRMLETENYAVEVKTTAQQAVDALVKDPGGYDIILTDLYLPGKTGFELLEELEQADDSIIKIVITGHATVDNAITSVRHGAYDFIEKPIAHEQLMIVLNRALEYRRLMTENVRYQLYLEEMVQQRSSALSQALDQLTASYNFTLEALVAMLDAREHDTGQHSCRVRDLALVLASRMGLSGHELEVIGRGAFLHDIGKIGIPDRILLKEGPLDEDEREVMKQHAVIGYKVLKGSPALKQVAEIVHSHQEHYDGSGYPRGLKGDEICLGSRIFAIVDAYDAMRSDRPYRKAMPREEARREIETNAGTQFDPQIVSVFLKHIDEMEEKGGFSS